MLSSSARPASLPPSLQVGPIAARVHRHVHLAVSEQGLILGPNSTSTRQALVLSWQTNPQLSRLSDEHEYTTPPLEIRGIVGIVRLWAAAYLLVIVHPKDIGPLPHAPNSPIFNLPPGSVHAIPLNSPAAAQAALDRIALVAAKADSSDTSSDEEDDSDDDDEGSRAGEVQTPGVEMLKSVLEEDRMAQGGSKGGSKAGAFFAWNPFKHASSSDKAAAPSEDGRAGEESEISSQKPDEKRLSIKWNPFVPRPKPVDPAVAAALPPPTTTSIPLAPPSEAPPLPLVPPTPASTALSTSASTSSLPLPSISAQKQALEQRILASLLTLYSSGQFFFSYDADLTRSPFDKGAGEGKGLPGWRRVKREFWWNEWLVRDFTELGAHSFVLPIMQGYVQTRLVNVPATSLSPALDVPSSTSESSQKTEDLPPPSAAEAASSTTTGPASVTTQGEAKAEPGAAEGGKGEERLVEVEIAVISRRSRDRAGLRYQRRGIDDEAHVANFVESEQIVKAEGKVFSFVQLRGSIPLFWSQSPYTDSQLSLKPAPTLDRPLTASLAPLSAHFAQLVKTYGRQTIVSLSEVSGKEGVVTNGYREVVGDVGMEGVEWREFDFHHECKGMKFENVSKLVDQMEKVFDTQGYGELSSSSITRTQQGTFRVNCIDCLDRTNVVQSAFARHVLGAQLGSVGLAGQVKSVLGGKSELEAVFNDVWANNGDAISRSYAGTSALKGDFTRTGKRDWQGMLNDGLNSVARMYSSAFSDFWTQAVIDFALGHRGVNMFTSEYMEKMSTAEPANLLRLSIIRSEAIETCSSRVLDEGETRVAGWTLFSPRAMNMTGGAEFEEKILLLTKKAIYVCSFDFNLEKVVGFTRIPLGNIESIQRGAYILSPLQEAGQDAEENYGFKLFFRRSEDDTRLTSYTVRNELPSSPSGRSLGSISSSPAGRTAPLRPTMSQSGSSRSLSSTSGGLKPLLLSTTKPLEPIADPISYVAFKGISRDVLLRRRTPSGDRRFEESEEDDARTCKELVNSIVTRIKVQCSEAGSGWDVGEKRFVVDEDVRSLSEAERETGLLARMEYGLKRLLWL